MMKRIEYKSGDVIGECVFIEDVNNSYPRKAKFKCLRCGRLFTTQINSVKNFNTRSCGCLQKHMNGLVHSSHGYGNHPLYKKWYNIKSRCYNERDIGFLNYGGRGIRMSEEWVEDPGAFIRYIEGLPNAMMDGHTIDRINNDGNYERGNLRWVTMHVQNVNRGLNSRNTTGFTGVSRARSMFRSTIMVNGNRIRLGHFNSAAEAVEARNKYITENNLTEYPIQKTAHGKDM
jgi:hypothetical protein